MAELTTLPSASWQDPSCGACYGETAHDGDGYACYRCGLWFDQDDDLAASYLDEDAEPCGEPCSNTWHGSPSLGPYDCHPCHLPAGHEYDHNTPCVPIPRAPEPREDETR